MPSGSHNGRAYILPDLLPPGLRVVFCGSAAGAVSAARGAYYAGPGNRFWSILAETGLTPMQLPPERFRELAAYGIGLTDLAKSVSGADASLPPGADDPAGLAVRIRAARPGLLAFNGKRAASAFLGIASPRLDYGPAPSPAGLPPIFVLPSTSGAARGCWDAAPWFALARAVGEGKARGRCPLALPTAPPDTPRRAPTG